ncbi:MFS transporter [Curtobacterium sp. MCPF17_002]|uniref:MFS transporter n=1 Tax=Curtobacterium sp. MCPF17_002 TaxID=2175645 RepID=UPI0015E8CF70|nr:MFS transporter [Curtobacterium sp. MCPF17_002]WIB76696.1 MFS transporter [Curtobacterium sp. MCPF17_002]
MSTDSAQIPTARASRTLPWGGLLALFFAGFLSIINETTPAGLLPQISHSLRISDAAAGQLITVYALATALTAVPLSAALARWGRRTLLISALAAFVLSNFVIASTEDFTIIMAARFVAGVGAGLIWTNLAAYAARLVPEDKQGRAMSIANAGTPVALAVGLPLGTLLGATFSWNFTFAASGFAGLVAILWVVIALPNLSGTPAGEKVRRAERGLVRTKGVVTILAVMSGFFLAHNILYTYVAPQVVRAGIGSQVELVLLVFGLAALVSIWVTGVLIDRRHRHLTVTGIVLLVVAFLMLGLAPISPVFVYVAVVLWGLGFGGGATWFLTAGFRATGSTAIAAVMVTLVNLMIGLGGLVGGLLIGIAGVEALPWVALAIMIPSAIAVVSARRYAFPHWSAEVAPER